MSKIIIFLDIRKKGSRKEENVEKKEFSSYSKAKFDSPSTVKFGHSEKTIKN